MARAVIVVTLTFLLTLTLVPRGHAWTSNYGEHERMVDVLREKLPCLAGGSYGGVCPSIDAGWADTSAAYDGKGERYIDEEYSWWTGYGDLGHAYFPYWPQGTAPENAQGFFEKASSYYRCYVLMRGLHFLQDMGVPLHTYDKVLCNTGGNHQAYEGWVYAHWYDYNFVGWFRSGRDSQLSTNYPSKTARRYDLTTGLASISRSYFKQIFQNPGCCTYTVATAPPTFAALRQTLKIEETSDARTIDRRIHKGGIVEGVYTYRGEPQRDVEVILVSAGNQDEPTQSSRMRTDEEGRFRFRYLPDGKYALVFPEVEITKELRVAGDEVQSLSIEGGIDGR